MRPDCVTGQLLAVKTAVVIKISIITSHKKRQSEGLRVNLNNNNNNNTKKQAYESWTSLSRNLSSCYRYKMIVVFFRGDEHVVGG